MNIITDFLIDNFILLVMMCGMFIITLFDVYLNRSMIIMLRAVLLMILALVIFDRIEEYTGNLEYFTYWRTILSVLCYTLRPAIVMMLIFIVSPVKSKLIAIPAVINFLVSATAFFSDITFSFEKDTNEFTRGILGYTPFIIVLIYIVMLYYITLRSLIGKFSEEGMILLFIALSATISVVLTLFRHEEVVNLTYMSCVLLYYMYLYAQYTKRDPLTSVFNRQTFHSDLKKRRNAITGVISVDMNDLKWMNDSKGHRSGDEALITIAKCFCETSGKTDRVYRVGGDEFMILSWKRTTEEMTAFLEELKTNIDKTDYSCAFGQSMNKSLDEMLTEADKLMYKDKARIKQELASQGIVRQRN